MDMNVEKSEKKVETNRQTYNKNLTTKTGKSKNNCFTKSKKNWERPWKMPEAHIGRTRRKHTSEAPILTDICSLMAKHFRLHI